MIKFDFNNYDFQYDDKYGLVLGQKRYEGNDGGMGDCIGTTCDAYYAYKNSAFVYGIFACFKFEEKITAYRHPSKKTEPSNDMSRDHIAYALVAFAKAQWFGIIKDISKYISWKISDRYSFTPDLWCYMKALAGSWFYRQLYYLITIPYMFFNMLVKKAVYRICNIPPEMTQKEWNDYELKYYKKPTYNWTPFQKKLIKLIYPMYSLYQLSFMLDVLPNKPAKWLLNRILLPMVDRQNYVVRIMLGDVNYTREEIYDYKPMWGGRWTAVLSTINDRDVTLITDEKMLQGNCVDRDLVRILFEERAGKFNNK